jgi:hypothetical protein
VVTAYAGDSRRARGAVGGAMVTNGR